MEASLHAPHRKKTMTRSRALIGTAALTLAVTVPNLSLGAMGGGFGGSGFGAAGDYFDLGTQQETVTAPQVPERLWTPSEQPAGAAYAATITIEDTSAFAPTFSSRSNYGDFDRELPLAVLEKGSESFDLAFAGIEMPATAKALFSSRVPGALADVTGIRRSAIQTATLEIEQITDVAPVTRVTPDEVGPAPARLAASSSSIRSNAIANRSVEAAFTGAIDASSAVRSSLPIAPVPTPSLPDTRVDEVRRAVPVREATPDVSARAAEELALVPKSKLDARVNGVLTGSVDFRQMDGTIAIRLRSVANVMRERFTRAEFSRLMGGQGIDQYVPLAELQAAGIPVNYNPAYDELEFGIDYQDAPNAKKVQVDQISIAPVGPELTAIEQIPR